MKKHYLYIIFLFCTSLTWANLSVEISKDSLTTKEKDTNNIKKVVHVTNPMLNWQKKKVKNNASKHTEIVIAKKFKSFPELNNVTKNLYIPPNTENKPEFTPEKVKELFKVDNNTQKVLDAGKEVFDIIEENQRFIDIITGQEVIELPVGIKQKISDNSSITLGITSMEYHPNYTVVDMFAKVQLKELNTELFFGANDVKISKEGGIYDEARLNLLADFPVAQNGGQWLITFKGGMNNKGKADSETYITINCEGKIKEMAFNADVRISKNVAVPLNEDGSLKYPSKTTPGTEKKVAGNDSYVGANFKVKASSLQDLLIELDLPMFELKALPNWGFKLDKTILDLSDTKNTENIIFPEIYRTSGLLQGNDNLWRGFHAKEVKVTLPPEFKKKGSQKRISIGAKNLFIDNFGISGDFYATNVLDINEGNANKWQISVDSIGVDLKVNRFIKGGFNGEIVLPISDEKSTGGKLAYKGLISADQHYSVQVETLDDVSFDIFKAKAKLFKGSYIKLEVENNKFYPEANLTGLMAFNAKQDKEIEQLSSESLNDSTNVEGLEFEGLSFQDLKIQTKQRPYLSIKYAGFKDDVKLPKIAGFELGFYDISIKTDENENAILGLNCFVNLDGSGIHGDVGLNIIGSLEEGDLLKWRYKEVEITDIEVDVKRKSFEFYGKIAFFKDNPVYGRGFAGALKLYSEDLGIEVGARGLFGSVDGYRYWFVDGHGRPTKSNNKNFTIFDIGGGVYHHMRKAGMDEETTSLSGIKYQPDIKTRLGFKALMAFEVKKGASFTGLAGIEMSFNSKAAGGGISRLGFYGAAMLIQGKSGGGNQRTPFGSVDEMQKTVSEKEQSLSNFHELSIDKEGLKYFADNVFPGLLTGEELFAAQVAVDFDFRNKSYWGLLDVYLNAGAIRGEGEKNLLGRLEYYNSPDDWYIYVGTPTHRFGLADIPIGPFLASINIYFMTGTILPDPALPPQNVIDILNLSDEELLFGRNFNQELAQGVGYAFGGKFQLSMGFDWKIVYARVDAGAGFDLMMRDFGDAHCKGKQGPIGMDGWYSIGQMYAYLQGEIGVKIKIFGIKKDIPILEAGLAVLAQAQLPNPWFVKGYAGVKVRVLGIVTINARLKVIIGEPCEIIGKSGLQEVVIISDISPRDERTDVDVFDAIQVAFNAPVNSQVKIEDDQGIKTYRISLEEFALTTDGNTIAGDYKFNDAKDLLTYSPKEILPPETKINATVKVSFEELVNGSWVTVTDDGKPVFEEKQSNFTTGTAPKKIPFSNIEYMYPIVNQQYMLPEESKKGYIQLNRGQQYLFGNGYSDELYFIDESGNKTKTAFTYNTSEKRLDFDIPNLNNQYKYTYALVTLNPGDIDEDKVMTEVQFQEISEGLEISNNTITEGASNGAFISRLNFSFNTSKHNTFKQKMRSLNIVNSITSMDKSHVSGENLYGVGFMNLVMSSFEPFGINDVKGTNYTANLPLIKAEAILNDSYYKQDINPLIYKEYPLDSDIHLKRDANLLGIPPIKSILTSAAYINFASSQTEKTYLSTMFPYRYHLPIVYYYDFKDLQYQITNRYMRNGVTNETKYKKYEYLIWGRLPFMRKEKYDVQFKYVLPKRTSGNSSIIKYQNTL